MSWFLDIDYRRGGFYKLARTAMGVDAQCQLSLQGASIVVELRALCGFMKTGARVGRRCRFGTAGLLSTSQHGNMLLVCGAIRLEGRVLMLTY